MAKSVIAVFTYRTMQEIIETGGSQAWALNAANARRCRYIVCTRNRHTFPAHSGPEEHGAAFLVGKISVIEASPERPDRFIVRFSEYAVLDSQSAVWPGSRNPVWYLDSLADLNINEETLSWIPVTDLQGRAAIPVAAPPPREELRGDAIRVAVARAYGVKPDNVTITITI